VLESSPRFDVAGEAKDGATAVGLAEELQPDVILLDLRMPVADGWSALRALVQVAPNTRVIILSGSHAARAAPLLAAGATAVLAKDLPPSELLERMGSILGHSATVQPTTTHDETPVDTPKPSLHDNERLSVTLDAADARSSDRRRELMSLANAVPLKPTPPADQFPVAPPACPNR
jgi:DNA-binding NarL/FixJ family response regulator